MKKFVYSGKCRLCECGKETGIYDTNGRKLFTGDIVMIFTEDGDGLVEQMADHLTVVVDEGFKPYTDGQHVPQDSPDNPYIVGIKDIIHPDKIWRVIRVKEQADVVHGEHWRDFGFSYREEAE
jgi:hypothetical protein